MNTHTLQVDADYSERSLQLLALLMIDLKKIDRPNLIVINTPLSTYSYLLE